MTALAEIERIEELARENERLRAEVERLEGELDDAVHKSDRLEDEVDRLERSVDDAELDSRQRYALAHGRAVLESAQAESAFARTMNERAVDAITELLGDR